MERRNLDTQGIGSRAFTKARVVIEDSHHFIQPIDGGQDIGIDGYIRIRKRTTFIRAKNGKRKGYEDYVDTGNIVGVQVKGVSSIPESGSNSYYITLKDKTKFGVNFSNSESLNKHRNIWNNFVGPVILIFVDLESGQCWWGDLKNEETYDRNSDYLVILDKSNVFNSESFSGIIKLGRELFISNKIPEINVDNWMGYGLEITNIKKSASNLYKSLGQKASPKYGLGLERTINPILGEIHYTRSGWKHITRLNRRKMRILNSLLLLHL